MATSCLMYPKINKANAMISEQTMNTEKKFQIQFSSLLCLKKFYMNSYYRFNAFIDVSEFENLLAVDERNVINQSLSC